MDGDNNSAESHSVASPGTIFAGRYEIKDTLGKGDRKRTYPAMIR